MADWEPTKQQAAFVKEYIIDFNGTKAAIRAGYSAKSARSAGARLLSNDNIKALLAVEVEARNKRTEINADYVLNRLVEIDQMDVADIFNDDMSLKAIKDWPVIWRQFISNLDVSEIWEGVGDEREMVGLLKKIKWPDKVKNLELIGKHVSVNAFKEKVEHTGKDGGPVRVVLSKDDPQL